MQLWQKLCLFALDHLIDEQGSMYRVSAHALTEAPAFYQHCQLS